MRKLILTFASSVVASAVFANIPPSNIATSTVAGSSVQESAVRESAVAESLAAESTVAASTVADSTLSIYEAWADAMNRPTAFPGEAVEFTAPVEPGMIQLDDPANWESLRHQAITLRLAGRTVYLAYSPYRKSMEMFELKEVLAALSELAPYCDGFAPAYRRSGAHYLEISRNLAALFCRTVREANPSIQLLGEAYFGELNSGENGYGVSVFTFPGCSALLGVNLPRGGRKQIEKILREAGIANLNLIDVLPRGVPPFRRYRNVLYIDMNNDN